MDQNRNQNIQLFRNNLSASLAIYVVVVQIEAISDQ